MRPGLCFVHKKVGETSHDVVRRFASAHPGGQKLCHSGTLDPFAQGLLVLLVGPATRLMDRLHALPKVYEAQVCWGVETDNGDPTGKIVSQGQPEGLSVPKLEASLRGFLGWTEQVPPPTSAKKIGGEPAYRRVHRGEHVELPASKVYLHEAQWLSHELPKRSRLRLVVKGGYYVRSLVRDLGRALGCGAHVETLWRSQIGPWSDPGPGRQAEAHGAAVLPWAFSRHVTLDERRRLKVRQAIPRRELSPPLWGVPPGFPPPPPIVLGVSNGELFALLKEGEDGLRSEEWFHPML